MAIALLSPTIARSKAAVVNGSTRVVLRLVPELKKEAGEDISLRAFSIVLSAIFLLSLLSLLVINTALNQDAFVLQRLKHEMNLVNDQRDALLRQAAIKASPATLSESAIKLGMAPDPSPEFIDMSGGTTK